MKEHKLIVNPRGFYVAACKPHGRAYAAGDLTKQTSGTLKPCKRCHGAPVAQ